MPATIEELIPRALDALVSDVDRIATAWESGSPPDAETATALIGALRTAFGADAAPDWLVDHAADTWVREQGGDPEKGLLVLPPWDFGPPGPWTREASFGRPAAQNDMATRWTLMHDPGFYDRVVVPKVVEDHRTGCRVWGGAVNAGGYPTLGLPTRYVRRPDGRPVAVSVHRLVHIAHRGSIGDGLVVDHVCSLKRCLSTLHLRDVTQAENVRAAYERRKAAAAGSTSL